MTTPVMHELFEQQAARTPAAVALISGDSRVTYGELNQRANRLAHRLRRLGVGPEIFVGVSIERSINAAIALLSILKAGGVYVYFDPGLPQKRIEDLRGDSQPSLVLTDRELQSPELCDEDSTDLPSCVTLDNAAYVLYTSGSTGKPKGAVEVHRSLTARLSSGELPDIQPDDVCCLNSSLGFGITTSRLFLPLVLGAQVAILSEADVKDAHRFLSAMRAHGITSVFLPPAQLRTILNMDPSQLAPITQLRAVTVTGSALTPHLCESFFRALPNTQLVNVYGSTEIGTTATMSVMTRFSEFSETSIGRPVANTQIYLLDERMAPAPAGETGEIYVSAPHMARGYLHQPELTAERFLNSPFAPNERLYRTGDLGRMLPNGEILLLGRRDFQVKIRGFRIELGEIEAVLEEHERIVEAVVIAQPDLEAENRLIAYFVAKSGTSVPGSKLRAFLHNRLPSHMVPSAFVHLVQLPRTTSGKVDRQALPVYDSARPDVESPYEAPRDAMEANLAGIWSEVLKVKDVGIHDNFLELGGDSLTATQVIAQARNRFNINLTLECLFDQTIAVIASRQGK
jgi:amino acid adenylation domain-containing protein